MAAVDTRLPDQPGRHAIRLSRVHRTLPRTLNKRPSIPFPFRSLETRKTCSCVISIFRSPDTCFSDVYFQRAEKCEPRDKNLMINYLIQ